MLSIIEKMTISLKERYYTKKTKIINKAIIFSGLFSCIISYTIAIITKKHYYADGAFFFVGLLNDKNKIWAITNDESVLRLFINIYNQFLFNIVKNIGIINKDFLSIVFAIPLYFSNIVGASIIYWICKKDNKAYMALFPILSYTLFNILSEIFVINPAMNAYWVYFIIFLYCMVEYNYTKYDLVILGIALLIALKSHEGILIFGVMIIIATMFKIIRDKKKNLRIRLFISMVLAGEVLYVLIWRMGITTQQAVSEGYLENILVLLDIKSIVNSNMLITIVGILLLVIFARKAINNKIYISLLLFSVIILSIVHLDGWFINPLLEYRYRVFITLGEIVFLFLTFLEYQFKFISKIGVKWGTVGYICAGLLICQSVHQIGNSFYWNSYLNSFKMQMNNSSECLVKESTLHFTKIEERYNWAWNQPVLSIALQKDYDIDKLILPADHENYIKYVNIDINNKSVYIPFLQIDNQVFNMETFFKKLADSNEWKKYDNVEYNNISLTCAQQKYVAGAKEQLFIKVKLLNNSTENIYNSNNFLSYHIYDSDRKLIVWDGVRTKIGEDIASNASKTITQTVDLSQCKSGGIYYCNIDLVSEGQFWYSEKGSGTTTIMLMIE